MAAQKFYLIENNDYVGLVQAYYAWINEHNLQMDYTNNGLMYHDFIHLLCGLDTSIFGETVAGLIEYCKRYGEENILNYDYVNHYYKCSSRKDLSTEQYSFLEKYIRKLFCKMNNVSGMDFQKFIFIIWDKEGYEG